MNQKNNPNENAAQPVQRPDETPVERTRQQQTDPNLTELKGLTDPDEDLEPKDTDNDWVK